MQKVLVLGANGYVGSHVMDTLIRQKYQVIASMQSISQSNFYRNKYIDEENLAFVTLADLNQENALQRIIKFNPDIDHVICLAQPPITGDCDKDFDRASKVMKNLIVAIDKYGHQVQQVVVMSSFAAMINDPPRFDDAEKIYTSRDVCQLTREQAKRDNWTAYMGVKLFAETSCWKNYSNMFPPPRYSLTTIALPMVLGPPIHDIQLHDFDDNNDMASDYFTNCLLNFAFKSIDNTNKAFGSSSHELPVPFVVDVRDAAMAFVRAIQLPPQTNRWFITSNNTCPEQVLNLARENLDHKLGERVWQPELSSTDNLLDQQCGFDTSDSDEAMSIQYTPFNLTVKETFEKLISFKQSLV